MAPMRAAPDAALSTSFGFGGLNAALVIKRA
jgi:3-oxoacyl-(acyl-carrier-protein) synthase